MEINAKNSELFEFRRLSNGDAKLLGEFFENLSTDTRSKFGPHPLTSQYAENELCRNVGQDNVSRFVVGSDEKVVGYFIVDFNEYKHERDRYNSYNIDLDFAVDPVFAPCIADEYQNQGIASQSMNALIKTFSSTHVRSLVLMGGTQAPNQLARTFYKKFGFEELGEFYTDYNGLNNLDMRLVFRPV